MTSPTTSETTTTSTTPITSTSTTPPPPPDDAADLKPFAADGKSVIVADTSAEDYREYKIKAGITNAGKTPADDVTINLYNTGNKIYTWKVETVGVGENLILETTVGDIVAQATFTPGKKALNIEISVADSSAEISGNNKSAVQDIVIAAPPAERRQYKSNVEKMIQESIDNATWYTSSNQNDLMTIVKEVLKDARVQWSMVHIDIQPFDKFNQLCSDSYGDTEQQKKDIKDWLEKNRMNSFSFVFGTTTNPSICLREGTLIQVLPVLLSEIGNISYSQANYSAYYNGYENGATDLVQALLSTYTYSVLRENFGFSGLSNISATIGSIPDLNVQKDLTLKRVWALTAGAGYINGDVPSADLLKLYLNFLGNQTPDSFLENLDKQVEALDVSAVTNLIRWRMVNSTTVMLPEDIVKNIDPSKTSLSLDSLISYQDYIILPW